MLILYDMCLFLFPSLYLIRHFDNKCPCCQLNTSKQKYMYFNTVNDLSNQTNLTKKKKISHNKCRLSFLKKKHYIIMQIATITI